jgi:hypothetical protein
LQGGQFCLPQGLQSRVFCGFLGGGSSVSLGIGFHTGGFFALFGGCEVGELEGLFGVLY